MRKYILLVAVILLSNQSLFSQVPSYVPSNGLVGYWPFSGNANDSSVNGNVGTVNGATLTTDRNGVANSAYSFNGSSSYISVPNNSTFNFQNKFTFSYWINPNSLSVNELSVILSKQVSYGLDQNGFNSSVEVGSYSNFRVQNGTSNPAFSLSTPNNSILINNWYHVVHVWTGTQGYIYINGVLVSQGTTTATVGNTNAELLIGKPNWSAGNVKVFNGKIDDIGIWNRALTAQEISSIYYQTTNTNCLPDYVPTNGLVGYWPFCGNANDASSNGNNGTVNGATLTIDRNGTENSAYSFDGVNDYIQVPVLNSINNANQISISAWINKTTNQIGTYFGHWSSTTQTTVPIGITQSINSNSKFGMGMVGGSEITSNASINLNTWQHLTLVYNGANATGSKLALYINGVFVEYLADSTIPNTSGNISNNSFIGANSGYLNQIYQYFNGKIDDVGVWNRVLTAQEIANLYVSCNSPAAPTGALTQTFCATPAPTVASLTATGTGIQWYAAATGGTPLATTTALVNGTTYYASQTVSSCESTSRLAVTVSLNDPQITASATTVCNGTPVTLSASTTATVAQNGNLPVNLQTGLVGYWPFNGNANDVSGNGNNGTVNGATLTTDRFGNVNSAYSFDGVSNYIKIETQTSNNQSSNYTWSFWFKSPVSDNNGSFLSNYSWFIKLGHVGTPGIFYKDEIGNQANNFYVQQYFNVLPQANIWHQVILQKVSNDISIILDGINIGSIISYGSFNFGQSFLTKIGNTYTDYYNGQIDDMCVWNRAITPSEITQLYTAAPTYVWSTGETTATINPTPTATTTYWCDVTVNGVTCRKTMTITVNPNIAPAFTQVAAICNGATLAALPTTSTNSITGTWSPALNNTATTTYTFTPTAGQCATTATMSITVNTTPTPTGALTQTFCATPAPTVASLTATGTGIQWYAAATGGTLLATTTALVNGTTYYASQTVSSCESTSRLAVTVSLNDPQITASATTVCNGTPVTLSASTTATSAQNGNLPANLQTGLVGYWPFNGNANDASGNANNGTVQNGTLLSNNRFNIADTAYDFDGINDQIEVNNNSSISPSQLLSINMWLFPRAYEDNKHCVSKGSHVNLSNRSYGIQGPESNQKARFFISNGTNEQGISTQTSIPLNQWTLITGVYDGATIKIYVNGSLDNQVSFSGLINNTSEPLLFGSHKFYSPSDYWFNGKLDDIAIYNRALSPSEIAQLYTAAPTYVWSTGETTATINPTPTTTTTYWCDVTVNGVTCRKSVTITVNTTTAPTGTASQTFCATPAPTVASLTATGTGIQWYAAANGGTALATTTALVNGTTYYASQTIGVCESEARFAVTVSFIDPQITASATTVCSGTQVSLTVPTQTSPFNIIDFSSKFNSNPSLFPGASDLSGMTTGNVTYNSVPFFISSWTNTLNSWNAYFEPGSNPRKLVINVNNQTITELNLLANTFWGSPGPTSYASVELWNETQMVYQKNLIGNIDLRDYVQNTYTNSINNTSTTNAWNNGTKRIDNQKISLPSPLLINKIVVSDTGADLFQRIFVLAITSKSVLYTTSYLWSTGETTATINPTPTATTTYWCDVTVNGVTCRKSVTITVNPNITPTFTQVAAICNGAALAALPTTSTNSITGTWSPALDNTTTTTYTFTPTAGQCATSATMTITVNPNITPIFTQVEPICNGATLAALPTTSTNSITGTWSPAINNTATTTYTYTPTAGQCATSVTMTITVNTTPTPTGTASQTFCATPAPTVASLTATGTGIQWYAAVTGGTPLATTTALVNGTTYYATQTVSNCESNARLAITVTLNDPQITSSATTVCSGTPVILSASTTATVAQNGNLPVNLQTGLVGYWPFNGNANDVSGNANNGTVNGATLTTDRFGNANSAYSFDGVDDFIESSNFCYNNGEVDQTVSVWFNPTSNTSTIGPGQTFFNSAPHNGFNFGYSYIGNQSIYIFKNSNPGVSAWNIASNVTFNTPTITLNSWHHALVVKQGLEYKFYYNGNFVGNLVSTINPIQYLCKIRFGAITCCQPEVFNGKLDDISLFNRALSASEITQLYNSNQATYLWSTGEITATINPTPTATTTYWCDVTVNGVTCRKSVTVIVNTPIAPTGALTQTFCATPAPTIASLTATGTGIQWYAAATGGTALATTTALVNGTTYYASQTLNSCESTTRLAVTVTLNDPQITASATNVCSGTPVTLSASTTATVAQNCNLPANLQTGLVGYWPFCGNANDASINGNNGTVNGATLTTDRFGNANSAYNFDGISNNISLPLQQNGIITYAVSTWFKTSTGGPIVSGRGSSNQVGLTLLVDNFITGGNIDNGKANFRADGPFISVGKKTNSTYLDNQWHHFVGVYDGAVGTIIPNQFSIYIDNVLVAQSDDVTASPMAPINNGTNILIGSHQIWQNGGRFNGMIDNIAIYDRALTPPEVSQLYNMNSATYLWSTGETTATINPTPTATTTYWCDVTVNGVTCRKSVTITVNPNITPTFTQVAPICNGATLAALPTTSTNNITGTWSPALDNTATTTYTFTPTAGQCATTATMTITVNPNITPVFTQVAPICNGATLAALPTTSTNNITGTWSPVLDNTATTTYTFTPTAGQCATTATMTINVNPNITPVFTQVAPICNGATLAALPTTSTNNITGTWSPALNNTATTTYTFTPTAGQCATTATMTITVNPNITPTFTLVAPICNGATLAALPTTSTNNITGTWSPALNNSATTTYTFTPTAGLCATTATMTITVNPNVAPVFTQVAPICNGATLAALLTTSTNNITGTWSPALNNTATTTYTFTPTAGQCATTATMTITVNPIITPAFTQVAAICSGADLSPLPTISTNGINGTWSPALNYTATTTYTFTPISRQCATTTTMTITVNPNITPTFTQVAAICAGAPLAPLPTISNNGFTGTWSPAMNNTATTTYTFTPTAGQCATTATMTITVNPLPLPPTGTITQTFCANIYPTLQNIVVNPTNVNWFSSLTSSTPLPITTNLPVGSTTYYASQFDAVTGCSSNGRLAILVTVLLENTPSTLTDQTFCSTDLKTLADIKTNGLNIVWYSSASGGTPLLGSYVLTSSQSLYAAIYNATTGCESPIRQMVQITIINCQLVANNLLTLNDNSLNDNLKIENIENFPINQIEIYNRFGELVWKTEYYNNDTNTFKGRANVSGVFQKDSDLPTGTYYFLLKYYDSYRGKYTDLKSFLYINNNN